MALLLRMEADKQVIMVGMNEVQFCDFGQTTKALGTRDLNGCHVVIVVSQYGALLGHISPRSGRQQADDVGDDHIAQQMHNLKTMYESYKARNFFPQSGSGTHTIHAMLNGEVVLPHQRDFIEQCFVKMALPRPFSYSYNVRLGPDADGTKGTVLLLGNSNPPTLMVENSVVFPRPQSQPVQPPPEARQTPQVVASSSTPSHAAANGFTGWTYSNQSYVALREGTIVQTSASPPLNQWVHNAAGWGDPNKKWMAWDGRKAQYR